MKIKEICEDFLVEEVTPSGEILEIGKEYSFMSGAGENLIFVVEKKNWNSIDVAKLIAKRLRISQKRVDFAGTKDRRAVTTQRMSVFGIKKEDLSELKIKDVKLTPLTYGDRVQLGDLQGNKFTIKITDISVGIKAPEKVPNFFGVQRFGTLRPITHIVGKYIVNEQFQKAVEAYLWMSSGKESEEVDAARKRLEEEQDLVTALKYFPKQLTYERTLLGSLAANSNDYMGALRKLPKKLALLFVHAYQSDLFNKVLHERLKLGLDPLEGDILEKGVPTGPIFGYEMELATGKEGEIEESVLGAEWLSLQDFKCNGMPELSSKGMRRPLYVVPEQFKILEKKSSEVTIQFILPKNCYATTVVDFITRKN